MTSQSYQQQHFENGEVVILRLYVCTTVCLSLSFLFPSLFLKLRRSLFPLNFESANRQACQ